MLVPSPGAIGGIWLSPEIHRLMSHYAGVTLEMVAHPLAFIFLLYRYVYLQQICNVFLCTETTIL